jgi:hypothetical protein
MLMTTLQSSQAACGGEGEDERRRRQSQLAWTQSDDWKVTVHSVCQYSTHFSIPSRPRLIVALHDAASLSAAVEIDVPPPVSSEQTEQPHSQRFVYVSPPCCSTLPAMQPQRLFSRSPICLLKNCVRAALPLPLPCPAPPCPRVLPRRALSTFSDTEAGRRGDCTTACHHFRGG